MQNEQMFSFAPLIGAETIIDILYWNIKELYELKPHLTVLIKCE